MRLIGRGAKLRRNLGFLGLAGTMGVVKAGFHPDQVHDTLEVPFLSQGQDDRDDAASEGRLGGFERALEACPVAVQLIDHQRARQAVLIREFPGLFRLHFHSRHAVDQKQGGVGRHHRAFRLVKEDVVPGRINEIDFGFAPLGVGERHADRDLALNLFLVVIGYGGPLVHFPEPVDHAGREEQRRN